MNMRIPTSLLFFLVLFVGAGCGRQSNTLTQQNPLKVEASAFRETPGLGAPSDYPDYTVLLKLSNRGRAAFVFDKMEIAWDPGTAKVLTGVSTPGQPGTGFRIEPGETNEYWESSSGRTVFLLNDADGKPLRFRVTLLRSGAPVFGPISASLPDLASLKNIHKVGPAEGHHLTFTDSTVQHR